MLRNVCGRSACRAPRRCSEYQNPQLNLNINKVQPRRASTNWSCQPAMVELGRQGRRQVIEVNEQVSWIHSAITVRGSWRICRLRCTCETCYLTSHPLYEHHHRTIGLIARVDPGDILSSTGALQFTQRSQASAFIQWMQLDSEILWGNEDWFSSREIKLYNRLWETCLHQSLNNYPPYPVLRTFLGLVPGKIGL